VQKLSNVGEVLDNQEKPTGVSFLVGASEVTIPMEGKIDAAKERESILKELEYNRGFLNAVDKKLSNERFVSSAPAQVIETERKKKADAEAKIKALEDSLSKL
jgi:valyl-tRNA synthetase